MHYQNISVFIIALCFGSFLHTLGVRLVDKSYVSLFSRLSIPSKCDYCGKKIPYPFLIPVLGYFFTAGKCRFCRKTVSPMYPVIELVYALIVWQVFSINGGITPETALWILAISAAVAASAGDIRTMLIPDIYSLIIAICGIGMMIIHKDPLHYLYGAMFLFIVFAFVLLVLPGSFGFGDLKFATAIGLLTGLSGSVIVLESALVIGSICGVIYGLVTKKGLKIRIPFAPFLAIGLYIALVYKSEIILMYESFMFGFS